ncbi:MAG TPA: hypothetical protein VGR31_03545 [Planctomycetota bacterium]|jgi:Tol biopolymer transport system component|nr:hypothetical protein [Planctomycetota bacterium]
MERGRLCFRASIVVSILCAPASAQITQRVSYGANGMEGHGYSILNAISADGRYVAFESNAANLAPNDTNGARDVFVRDRRLGTTERVSVDSNGNQSNQDPNDFFSIVLSISADGQVVAFETRASNLVPGDTNGWADVFVRDRLHGTTERVSVDSNGAQAMGPSIDSSVSGDGRYVAFMSYAPNVVANDLNGSSDIFVRDRLLATTERVSVDSNGGEADGNSRYPSISPDGRYVVFASYAANLVPGDTNGNCDIFLHDRQTGATELVSLSSGGLQGNGISNTPSVSADGRYVAFDSLADNLVPNDTNFASDNFVHDRVTGTTVRANVSSSGAQADLGSFASMLSTNGRFLAFWSESTNLVPGDSNGYYDVFVRDLRNATTERVSVGPLEYEGNAHSDYPWISADGEFVSFSSFASNFDYGDSGLFVDVFVRDRTGGPPFSSWCNPGLDGVIPCPCGNPPSGPGRGCNNSANTGGAVLSASGGAFVSSDSLVLTANGEVGSTLNIVWQSRHTNSGGAVYGQGVHCLTGNVRRLYTRQATGGSISFPDLVLGESRITDRCMQLADFITPGAVRWYAIDYRDPVLLGGCSPVRTFNSTQMGRIVWAP